MTRFFTHYWSVSTVEEHQQDQAEGNFCSAVFSNRFSAKGLRPGDYLYELSIKDGVLYVLCRLRISEVRGRTQPLSPGERVSDNWNEEAIVENGEATPLRLLSNQVPIDVTERIECITNEGVKGLTFEAPGKLDRQTLRVPRELTEHSAALLDGVIADFEERLLSPISDALLLSIEADIETESQQEQFEEGKQTAALVNRYERNPRLRARVIQMHGTRCQACGFSFRETYGEHGGDFIEVHHKRPISSYGGVELVDPRTDMAVLCSNCHRMIHRNPSSCLSVEQLRAIIEATRRG
ncbi:MAG TPA: HNH endonuclease [Ktedonobacterales bacterium]|jgi:hypothetical protein